MTFAERIADLHATIALWQAAGLAPLTVWRALGRAPCVSPIRANRITWSDVFRAVLRASVACERPPPA